MKESQMIRWLVLLFLFSTVFSSLESELIPCCNKNKELINVEDPIDEIRAAKRNEFMKENSIELPKIDDLLLQGQLEKQLDLIILDSNINPEDKVDKIKEKNEKFKFIADYQTKYKLELCPIDDCSLLIELYKKIDIIQNQNKTTEEKKRMIEKEKNKLLFFDNHKIQLVTLYNSSLQDHLEGKIYSILETNDDVLDPKSKALKITGYQKTIKFFDDIKIALFDLDLDNEIAKVELYQDMNTKDIKDKIEMIRKLQEKFQQEYRELKGRYRTAQEVNEKAKAALKAKKDEEEKAQGKAVKAYLEKAKKEQEKDRKKAEKETKFRFGTFAEKMIPEEMKSNE